MKRIWLVRHGESQAQSGETHDGLDPELSELGIRQAKRLVDPLRDLPLDVILVSPLRRAWQTFELSKARAGTIEYDSRLIESHWGNPDSYKDHVPITDPALALPDHQDAWMIDTEKRSAALLEETLESEEKNMLFFAHCGILASIFGEFTGANSRKNPFLWPHFDNAAISLLEVNDQEQRILKYWNYNTHVKDLLR